MLSSKRKKHTKVFKVYWICSHPDAVIGRNNYNGIFVSYLTVTRGLDVFACFSCVKFQFDVSPKGQFVMLCVHRKTSLIYWNLRFFCLWPYCFVILDLKKFFSARWNVVVCDGSWFAFVVWFDLVCLGLVFYLPWVLRRAIFALLKCFYKENRI